jgi:hypothetical protein
LAICTRLAFLAATTPVQSTNPQLKMLEEQFGSIKQHKSRRIFETGLKMSEPRGEGLDFIHLLDKNKVAG